jgi:hypothetical protein
MAVIETHASTEAEMAAVRANLLAHRHDPRGFVEAIVTRLCRMLDTPETRDFLRFSHQLMMRAPHRKRLTDEVDDPHLASMQAEMEMLHDVLPNLPERIVRERAVAGLEFIILQVAERARIIDDDDRGEPILDEGEFISNLVDMATGMLTAPTSGETRRPRLVGRRRGTTKATDSPAMKTAPR